MASSTRSRRPARARTEGNGGGGKRPRPSPRRKRPPLLTRDQLVDLVGLALIALGLFAAAILLLGADGGAAGQRLTWAFRSLVGDLAVLLPPIIVAAGALVLFARLRASVRLSALVGAVLLAVAALLLVATDDIIGPAARDAGGILGGALHRGVAAVAGGLGVVLIALFLALAGVLLLTGWSVASVARRVHEEGARTWEALRAVLPSRRPRGDDGDATRPPGERRDHGRGPGTEEDDAAPSEPAERRSPRGARPADDDAPPPFDGASSFPELFVRDEAPLPEPPAAAVTAAAAAVSAADASVEDEEASGRPGRDDEPFGLVAPGEAERSASDYRLPDADVLARSVQAAPSSVGQERVAEALLGALRSFGVEARIVGTVSGPRVTRYELQLAPGTKVGRVAALRDDLAYALATTEIRILAPIPGKQAVGVEVPNLSPNVVTLGDIHGPFPAGSSPLTVWLGKDIAGQNVHADLAKMPHLLVAGTTGSGKSGCLNAMLVSILLNATPEEARLILIDPKKVELNHYEAIPHLLTPVVTNMKGAAAVLLNIVGEMERRYEVMGTARARNLGELNRMRREKGRETLPHILVVIDELADLMMVSPAEVEDAIIRLAQKSRAVGIHLVLATQRPSVDVITGMIKANVPSRIAFAVSSMTDSRVILDGPGAESLLGQGDMLFRPLGTSRLQRVQGAFVTEEEIALVVEQCRRQAEPEFEEELLELPEIVASGDGGGDEELSPDQDDLLDDAIRLVVNHETASVSLIQRRLRVGYTRAGRLIDMLERRGVISGYEGSKPRQVLITEADLPRLLGAPAGSAPE